MDKLEPIEVKKIILDFFEQMPDPGRALKMVIFTELDEKIIRRVR